MRAIDLFAGAGGFTEGANLAGVDVVWAANHWGEAVEIHAANHPGTQHVCQDLNQADWTQVPAHDLILASPCSSGHPIARGKDRPHHDAARSTAWAVVSAAEYHRPKAWIVENTPEFLDWNLYPAWAQAMQALGYFTAHHVIDAADLGVPQNRQRVFIVGTLDRAAHHIKIEQRPHTAIRSHIDLEAGRWSQVTKPGRAQSTLDRVRRGREVFGSEPFVAPYYGSGSGKTGRSLDRPLGTVTTRDRWAVIHGDRLRMLRIEEYQAAMGFRPDYLVPRTRKEAIMMLGNAVCPPVAAEVIKLVAQAIQ